MIGQMVCRTVRSDRKLGFTTERVARDYNLTVDQVQAICRGEVVYFSEQPLNKSIGATARAELKKAEKEPNPERRAIQVRAVYGNFSKELGEQPC
jgi:hypothetical protein